MSQSKSQVVILLQVHLFIKRVVIYILPEIEIESYLR